MISTYNTNSIKGCEYYFWKKKKKNNSGEDVWTNSWEIKL